MNFSLSLLTLAVFFSGLIQAGSFPRVRIFNPRQGSVWYTGEKRTIVWELAYLPPPPYPPTVNITLRKYNDSTFRLPLAVDYPTDSNLFVWTIPYDLPSCDQYQIRIIPNRAYPGHPNIMASKSKPFSILSKNIGIIELLNPTSKSVWSSDELRSITWFFKGATSSATVSIYIEETKYGYVGKPVPYPIVESLPYATDSNGISSYKWRVPFTFRSSPAYKITLVGYYNDGRPPVTSVQKDGFTINQSGDAGHGSPTVVFPEPTVF